MNEINDKVITKIKKLLALSKSTNCNESATALEMAQRLIKEYEISYDLIKDIEITENKIETFSGKKPPFFEMILVGNIADAFGCDAAYGYRRHKEDWTAVYGHTFVGVSHRAEVASYMAEILLRKLKKARTEYVKSLSRVRIRRNKTKRADDFCIGWVMSVSSKLSDFTNTEDEKVAISSFIKKLNWGNDLQTIKRGEIDYSKDFQKGSLAGNDIELHHGVNGKNNSSLLLESAM